MKKKLLVIAHVPSENTQRMRDALVKGASDDQIENTEVKVLNPLNTQPNDINLADAIVIGTTENLGYMAGLVKDVFDRCFYECAEKTEGMPFTFYVRAGHDGTGTKTAIQSITTGMKWKLVQEPLVCRGEFSDDFLDQCEELGLTMAASLDAGII